MADEIQELLAVAKRADREAVTAGLRYADPLLWALVPLYLLRKTAGPMALTGADVSRFWGANGVWRSRGTVTGAYWRHIGYARHVTRPNRGGGWLITPNGVKYVEQAIAGRMARRGR